MRPSKLAHAQPIHRRLMLALIGKLNGETPDILRLLYHRTEFFGRPFCAVPHAVLRGPSAWSVADRETIATRVSRENQCPFCETSHEAVARLADPARDVAKTAGGDAEPRLAAALDFAAKLTSAPDSVGPADAKRLRKAGLSDEDIEDVIDVCFVFCCINRVANALDFEVLGPRALVGSGKRLLSHGYKI